MKATLKSPNTQEGTSDAGESLSVSTVAAEATVDTLSPLVSGGATRRVELSLVEERCRKQDQGVFAVPRSLEVSEEDDNVSVCSALSMMSASSAASSAVRAKKRGRRAGALEDIETPTPKRKLRSNARTREEDDDDISLLATSSTRAKASLPGSEELAAEMKAQPTADLGARIAESLESVEMVADRSKNLKGNFVRSLRIAARTVKAAADEIALRALGSSSERLEAENAALRSRLSSLEESLVRVTKELEELRQNKQFGAKKTASPVITQKESVSLEQIGVLLDQRLAAFRAEMFPDRAIRPPLQRKVTVPTTTAESCTAEVTTGANAKTNAKRKPKKKNKNAQDVSVDLTDHSAQNTSGRQARPLMSTELPQGQTRLWSQVTSENSRKTPPARSPRAVPASQTSHAGQPKLKPNPKPPRALKTAAITVTVPTGSNTTYSAVMTAARQRVKLADIGITNIRQKRAATGGIIIEIPGTDAESKAEKLADAMRNALSDFTDARIAHPLKMREIRVLDLDESITPEEIALAVAEAGACSVADVKVGQIRLPPNRLGTAWVKCPLTAVRKIAVATTGRITIGAWHSARVKILQARPLQCYKCLKIGHVRAKCPNDEDRSDRCYACGQPGHTARGCTGTTFTCPVCSDLGLPADHRLGSKKCTPPKPKRARVQQGPATTLDKSVSNSRPDFQSPEEAMEAENSRP